MSKPPKALKEITESDYQKWRHHPVTQMFLQYMRDWESETRTKMVNEWIAGNLTLDNEKEVRGWHKALTQLGELEFRSIEDFYRSKEELENEAAPRTPEDNR